VLPREDARDAIVLPASMTVPADSAEAVLARLGSRPCVGTSSVRRIAQLIRLFPTGSFRPIRGNLDTRLRKVDAGEFDAIVLAAAGLKRLGQGARISALLPVQACVPAPGQGIIAIEIRADDHAVRDAVMKSNDRSALAALDAERAVVSRLGGGCQMPIGAYATVSGESLEITALVVSLDGARVVRADASGLAVAAREVGASPLSSCSSAALAPSWRRPSGTRLQRKGFSREQDVRGPMVWIIGAGPGDPSLITVRGLECLRAADIIVHDH
jgi:hydroxymethylbilane synthase